MQSNNRVIIAAAGARKTTFIVEEALTNCKKKKVLIITYTIENLEQIKDYIIKRLGSIPGNIEVKSWYTFLLSHGVRPYQNSTGIIKRIPGIFFINHKSVPFIGEHNILKHYLSNDGTIYTDKIAKFTCLCNEKTNGKVINRLEQIYGLICIDEVQDLAGYDFNFLELLFNSNMQMLVVGDCRQATYFTNCSPKNSRFKGLNIINLFQDWEEKEICEIKIQKKCYRCIQEVCDFADKLYPDMDKTISENKERTGHDGIFIIKNEKIKEYFENFSPKILRYDKRSRIGNLPAVNFGIAKGKNFDRVLIIPNKPIREYLHNGDQEKLKVITKAKLYVAITRARYSVTFLYEGETIFEEIQKIE